MVASTSEDFTDALADALQEEGAVVICVQTMEGAMDALEDGFRPSALVVDGTLSFARGLVARLRRHPELRDVQVIAASPIRSPAAFASGGVMVMKRHDISAVVNAVDAQQRLVT